MAARENIVLYLAAAAVMINAASAANATAPTAYVNHTVGGAAGWFFNPNTNQSSTNFSAWAATQTFNLGDYLIFHTDTNQTVIQTYNKTTYRSCTTDDASDTDTFEYNGGSNFFGVPMTVAVPLTIEVPQYYFSDADDGFQCQNGMAFAIKVSYGLGLPPSLNQPPPPPYVEPPSTVEGGKDPFDTIISSPPVDGSSHGTRMNARFLWMVLLVGLVFASV